MVKINDEQIRYLEVFQQLVASIPGFEPFLREDVDSFLNDAFQFSLSIKKVRGEGILYGLDHADVRRKLVNLIPDTLRKDVLYSKLHVAGIFLNSDSPLFGMSRDDVLSIGDIGMGHSIYVVQTKEKAWVVKEGTDENQEFYGHLLSFLDWPSIPLHSVQYKERSFSIVDYLGGQNLNRYTQCNVLDSSLEEQLARHAALADFFGRGDRHFENYMVFEDTLYPIDVNFLFWKNNEQWLSSYIKAGMAEYSYFSLFDHNDYVSKSELFFFEYQKVATLLKDCFLDIENLISSFYREKAKEYICFVKDRLYSKEYIHSQRDLYKRHSSEYKKRKQFKDKLADFSKVSPDIFKNNPYLKMYYLADKGRHTTFFLSEQFGREVVFDVISNFSSSQKVFSLHH